MSEHESEVILENLNKKLFKQNKLLTITEKLEELIKQKPVANTDEDKEKMKKPLKSAE